MKNLKCWIDFEDCLNNADEIKFWLRDDDVKAEKRKLFNTDYWKYKYRLSRMLSLYKKYNIPALLAVVPNNFEKYGKDLAHLLKKHKTFVALHGTEHISNSNSNILTEYPENCDVNQCKKTIINDKKKLQEIFGDKLLPVFIPPFNSISESLKEALLINDFEYISTINNQNQPNYNYNVDIDFENWSEFEQKPDTEILESIITLIKNGNTCIGFNAHHKYIKRHGVSFFIKFFKTVKKHDNVKWILPF